MNLRWGEVANILISITYNVRLKAVKSERKCFNQQLISATLIDSETGWPTRLIPHKICLGKSAFSACE